MSIFDTIDKDADPEILLPNRYSEALRMWFVRCPCGASPGQHDGFLDTHFPQMYDRQPCRLTDPFGSGSTCRYSGRSLTLAAAIARDDQQTREERRVSQTIANSLRGV